jgi:hypothetical protein
MNLNISADLFLPAFTSAEAAEAADLNPVILRCWADRGLIGPLERPGTGHPHQLSTEYVVAIAIMGKLRKLGVQPSVIAQYSKVIGCHFGIEKFAAVFLGRAQFASAVVWVAPSDYQDRTGDRYQGMVAFSGEGLDALMNDHPAAFVLDLQPIVDEVKQKLSAILARNPR